MHQSQELRRSKEDFADTNEGLFVVLVLLLSEDHVPPVHMTSP